MTLHEIADFIRERHPGAVFQWNPSAKQPRSLTVVIRRDVPAGESMDGSIGWAAGDALIMHRLGRCTYSSMTANTRVVTVSMMFAPDDSET
jgi:hypothetical protein